VNSAPKGAAAGRITEVTRRRLLDGIGWLRDSVPTGFREFMEPGQTFWSGALSEIEFLERLYDLSEMPSHDRRFPTAYQDVFHHRVMNDDWPDTWIFTDERFGLADNDEALLRFLAEMLHPAVRTGQAEVERLHTFLNSVLAHDGYELVRVDAISGAPIFDYRLLGSGVRGSMRPTALSAGSVMSTP
jgi:hypothetical protein